MLNAEEMIERNTLSSVNSDQASYNKLSRPPTVQFLPFLSSRFGSYLSENPDVAVHGEL